MAGAGAAGFEYIPAEGLSIVPLLDSVKVAAYRVGM